MRGTVLYGPRDIRFEDRETPKIDRADRCHHPDRATCVCGSDLWPYRGLQPIKGPTPMGHEYCGIVEEVGSAVRSVKPGQFVDRLVRHVRQHVPQLPVRLPVVVRAPRVHHPGAGAGAARAAGGRDAGADAGRSAGRPGAEPAGDCRTCWAPAGSPPTRRT